MLRLEHTLHLNHPSLLWIFCFLVHCLLQYEHGVSFSWWEISCKMSIFITSIALNIGRISLGHILFLVLNLVVIKCILLLLILEYLPGVNCKILIFSCSHILFYCHTLRFCLCTFFLEYAEIHQSPSCTNSLNEWVPWSRETIQGSH